MQRVRSHEGGWRISRGGRERSKKQPLTTSFDVLMTSQLVVTTSRSAGQARQRYWAESGLSCSVQAPISCAFQNDGVTIPHICNFIPYFVFYSLCMFAYVKIQKDLLAPSGALIVTMCTGVLYYNQVVWLSFDLMIFENYI